MILPRLEQDTHGVQVACMFSFEENAYMLQQGKPIGERQARVAADKGMLLMACGQCAY